MRSKKTFSKILFISLILAFIRTNNASNNFENEAKRIRNLFQNNLRTVPRRSVTSLQETMQMGSGMQSRAVDKKVQLEIKEGEPIGTLVGKIPMIQGFTYRFNEQSQEFTLDPVTGDIKTAVILDREALSTDRFDLVVLSSQPTYPIEVRIVVLDVNDNAPEFPDPSISVTFSESAVVGTKIFLDLATDKDTEENGVSDDYFIANGNIDNKFQLSVTESAIGETNYLHLETTSRLDRELVEHYFFNVCARDKGRPPKIGCMLVNVTVLDVNDNPPTFMQSDYVVSVNESAPVGSHVLTVRAIDKDTGDNAKLTYYLPDSERQFTIDPETGEIFTAELLDCPQQSCAVSRPGEGCPKSCVITAFVRDHGSPKQEARAYITVNLLDANDHDPEIKFTYFPPTAKFATVDENAAKDSIVAAIGIIDKDEGLNGETIVEIVSGNELGHFKVTPSTAGFYILQVKGKLDREEISMYNLSIVATDKGTPPRSSSSFLVIQVNDVNDHEPVFQQSEYSCVLSELAPIGSFVASILATDADSGLNAKIYYNFVSGNDHKWFSIDQHTGLVTTISQLDREIQGNVELKISAKDGGPNPKFTFSHLRITILDENDEAPKFKHKIVEVTLSENIPSNSLVATLSAVDNDQGTNGSIAYSLHSSVHRVYPNTFVLDSLTGQLMTKTALDREKLKDYEVLVIAKDQGIPPLSSTATILLNLEDVNDNSPSFYPIHYFFPISQEAVPGILIGKVFATDPDTKDNAQIRYILESGGDGFFAVDERKGEIFLQSSLKRIHKDIFNLVVSAKDMGDKLATKNANVEIIRKEKLKFADFKMSNGYQFKITESKDNCSENPSVEREVGSVQLETNTNLKVTYNIVYGDRKGNFKINDFNGMISAVGCIDREEIQHYSLQISARAGLIYGTTVVNITVLDINDNPPTFLSEEKENHFLKENVAVGQEVYFARARDKDTGINARITYTLTLNPDNQFRISENTGVIYTAKPITATPGTVFLVEVTAVDSGTPSLSTVNQIYFSIEDVNNHTPFFNINSYEISIPESTLVNERFFALIAKDNDVGLNGRIFYSISNGNLENRFGIFPDGQLYVKNVLDREEQDYYALDVTASDQGFPKRSTTVPIVIHIIDDNDNAPKFSNSSFTFHLRENEPADTFVGKLLASDQDIGRNADLTFSLSSTQQDFSIDPRNGFIRSLIPFDREQLVSSTGGNLIMFEAIVFDNGIKRLKDKVKVGVYINDVNDNTPQFKRLPYKVQMSEAAPVGTQLIRVYTTDADEGLNGDVFYSLTEHDHEGQFSIDEATGQISLARSFDRETRDNYFLTVIAHDAGLESRLSSSAVVQIEVLDENDNAPIFIDNTPKISVLETSPINLELLRFNALDADVGLNSELIFSITGGNRRDAFQIDTVTGVLYLRRPLDYEELKVYFLNITCSDTGHPKLSSTITLEVNVIDTNDNPPVFPNTAIVRQIVEGLPVHRPVVTVTAEDPDSGENSLVTYSIVNQDPEDQKRRFAINPTSGVIHTVLPIDREEIDTFRLTVVATDSARPASTQLSAEKLVVVIVTDVNDNAPIFKSLSATVLPVKSSLLYQPDNEVLVTKLEARDLDSSTNGLVTYELLRLGANYTDMFRVQRNTGALYMTLPSSPTMFEKLSKLRVGVRATDEAVQTERKSSETYVTLILPGEGDDSPIWEHGGKLEGSVYENEPAGTSILRVKAKSRRSNEELEYYVTNVTAGASGPQVDRLFDIEVKSGLLSTAAVLDREDGVEWYEVEIYAIVSGGGKPSTSSTKIRVNVLDKNDVSPRWDIGQKKYDISEDAPQGTLIAHLIAHDPDTIGNIKYSIVQPPPAKGYDSNEDNLLEANRLSSPFKLDGSTGQLRLAEPLDREAKDSYVLRVRADDGLQHTDCTLNLLVTDTNDNAPNFHSTVYSFDIPENEVRGNKVGQISSTDIDGPGPNSQISYSLISDWANDVFSLNPSTGVLTLTATLDYEQVQHYILVVQAIDAGTPSLSSTVTVYCNVVDLNDNAPTFELGPRSAEIFENVPIGKSVLSTNATDLDSGNNGHIVYSIVSGDDNEDFGISDNGTLYTRKLLDREVKAVYNLVLKAQDTPKQNGKALSNTIQVTINLLDINDQSPEFISNNQTSIIENSVINSVVTIIKAIDRDEARNGYVEYSLEPNDAPFTLGNIDGVLRVSGQLDRELTANYTLKIIARDRGDPPKYTIQNLLIIIVDENDNSPVFDARQYSANIPENASVGISVLQVSAKDRDDGSYGRVRYSIASGDSNLDFTISEDGGVIRVAKNLNYERQSSYKILLRAEDSTYENTKYDEVELIINVIDVNDNSPIFLDSPYSLNVMENILPPNGGFIMKVNAYDADKSLNNDGLRYFLKEGDPDLFRINASTGDIFLMRSLDREKVAEYSLTLVAMDSGTPALTGTGTVNIAVLDVNDHKPKFGRDEYKATVTENLPAGAWVAIPQATDKDQGLNSKIRYTIIGEKSERFHVNSSTGDIVTTEILDREETSVYYLTMVAQDLSPTEPQAAVVNVTIFVKDVNDNSPRFSNSKLTAYIPDSTTKGDFVFGAKARDNDAGENARITYRLYGRDASRFVIDSNTGVIRAKEKLRASAQNPYQLQIEATDSGIEQRTANTDLSVYLWERQQFPSFKPLTSTNFKMREDASIGRLITTLSAVTPKTGPSSILTFAIAGGNVGEALTIEPNTGEIFIASQFDYETLPYYEAWVEVRDSGNPPLRSVIQLVINVTDANDNPPIMEHAIYNASIIEDQYPPQFVAKVSARDADSGENGEVTYRLLNDFEGTFSIDAYSGEISTNNKLDREEISSYELTVEARDKGIPQLSGTAIVLITIRDKNDNPPRFTHLYSANVTENSEIGTFVVRMTSHDPDSEEFAEIQYSITDNPGNKFNIDPLSGNITVAGHLDRESQDEYLIKVSVSDGAWTAETPVTITIQDQNDNAPEFDQNTYHFHFPELEERMTRVGQLVATDRDKPGPNSIISYSLLHPSDLFTIDPATGEIYSKQILKYKYSNQPNSPENLYSFYVVASDNGRPPLTSKTLVYISITNANNHAPKFEQKLYLWPVPEHFPTNKKIAQVTATDLEDFSINSEIEYSAIGGNGSDYFHLDHKSGSIYIKKSLEDFSLGTIFVMNVRATDKGVPPLTDEANVTLVVIGENRHAPEFAAVSYQVRVPENEPVNTTILMVNAVDLDNGPNGMVRYQISAGNENGVFSINSITGAVVIVKPLDYDTTQDYKLNITAKDLGFEAKYSIATLTINVSDVNDNPPIFNQTVYEAYLPENSPVQYSVFKLSATDKDSPKYAFIQYRILGGSGKDHFSIESNTGIIRSKIQFDFEETNEYTLDIVATNPDSNAQMHGFTTLIIHITGVNEYHPKFIQPVFHMDVSESAAIGTSVGLVQATDRDLGIDGKVFYLFVGSSNDRGFAIGSETGIISVSRRLDRETQNRAILTVLAKNIGSIRGNDTDEAQVIISIQDGNDPPEFLQPYYQTSVSEGEYIGTRVMTVRAVDKDVRPQNNQFSYSIISGNVDQAFKIDPQSGDIETAKTLDRETLDAYELVIGAIDTGIPPQTGTSTVKIIVNDINDNGPIFEVTDLLGYVNENEPANTIIMTLNPKDPDLPPNGAPFSFRVIGGKHMDLVTVEKHTGVLKTTRILDRETTPQLEFSIQVEDSGQPRQKSEHAITVRVLDKNDCPSNSRSVRVLVYTFNSQRPLGFIADIRPNDPDTTGDYACKIIQTGNAANILSIPNACNLHAVKIEPGIGYSLSVSGNDGLHPDVISMVTVDFINFSNATVENSIIMLISRVKGSAFLSRYYKSLIDLLQSELGNGENLQIYSIDEKEDHIEIYVAISYRQGYRTKQEVREFLQRKRRQIEALIGGTELTIGYSPCKRDACNNGGICSENIMVHDDARVIDSPALILTSPRIVHDMICKCRDGFAGDRCEKKQDPCSPNPCISGGQCRRIGYDFHCSCPVDREGRFCELQRSDPCSSNPCRNGGSCKESPDGLNFFCLCKAGYRGNHCELETDACRPNPCLHGGLCVNDKPGYQCSCPDGRYGRHCEKSTYGFGELSYMTFPSLDSNTNDISIIFATTKPNALLLYNYGLQSGGRSDFIVLELVEGRLVFSCGGARNAITTLTIRSERSLADGEWHKVTATRNARVVSLSVSKCKDHGDICDECRPGDDTCYVDDVGPIGTLNFNNNPLLLGGLSSSDPALERPGQLHSDDLVGCVHSVFINGRSLNLSNPLSSRGVKASCSRTETGPCSRSNAWERDNICGHGKCYDKWDQAACQCGRITAPNCVGALEPISLAEGGFIEYKVSEKHRRMQLLEYLYGGTTLWHGGLSSHYNEESLVPLIPTQSPAKSLHLMFRTVKSEGILIYASSNKHYTSIELRNGQISYTSLLSSKVNISTNYVGNLADGRWHNLTVHSHNKRLKIFVDSHTTAEELDTNGIHDFLDPYLTQLHIGGIRPDIYAIHEGLSSYFEGCLANFTVNGELQPFNGSGSIFSEILYRGKIQLGCRSPIGITAASAADPLSVGITLVIVFFIILIVAILASFVIFHLRRQSKEKSAITVIHKNTNAIITGNTLVTSSNDNLISRHENTYITDGPDLRHLSPPELISKKYKERELNIGSVEHRSQRPDIIEREIVKPTPPIREEHPPPIPSEPEHYDLENASSIAPSDIDIVYHYKGYRDGMRKYKATPPPINSYHKHVSQQSQQMHRHGPGVYTPRSLTTPVASSPSTPKMMQSTPLARLSPSSELSSQQPRILTLHDISGKPLQTALLATTSSSGGGCKEGMNSNSERSLNSPIMSQLSSSTNSRKAMQQSGVCNEPVNNIVASGPMGLTAEEVERLNSRPRNSSLVSTLDAVSSSSEARGHGVHGPLHLRRNRRSPPPERLKRRTSSTTDESGRDSFTCSEIEYDNNSLVDKRSDDIYSKPDDDDDDEVPSRNGVEISPSSKPPPLPPPNIGGYDGFDSSFRGSLSTLVASDDDMSAHMGLYKGSSAESQSATTALSWDYLLNWGPNFESLVGVFIDIAELPDGSGRIPSGLRFPSNINHKQSEEYV